MPRNRRVRALIVGLTAALALSSASPGAAVAEDGVTTPPAPVYTVKAPSRLAVISRSSSALALTWDYLDGVTRYEVQYSRSAAFTNALTQSTTRANTELVGLSPATTYYLRTRAVDDAGAAIGPFSSTRTTSTRSAKSYPLLSPSGLRATLDSTGRVTWNERSGAAGYRVQYALSAKMANPVTTRSRTASITLDQLPAGATYFVRVRTLNAKGSATSEYTRPVALPLEKRASDSLRIASFNVRCASCFAGVNQERPWSTRAPVVARQIREAKPDVIGVQEATQGRLKSATGTLLSKSQFEDLAARVGAPYRLVNSARYNCVKSTTKTRCAYQDRGASRGTRILFNTATVLLEEQGAVRLAGRSAADDSVWVAWAIFTQKATGKRFFFANTHLYSGGGSTLNRLRDRETTELLAAIQEHNPTALPSFVVGDFNTHKWVNPSNGPYARMLAARFVDPLGNVDDSTWVTKAATVEARVRTNYSSFNNFERHARQFGYVNGTYIDYIFTSPMRVTAWETVVDVDGNGDFVGVIPSDHNLIQATVVLP